MNTISLGKTWHFILPLLALALAACGGSPPPKSATSADATGPISDVLLEGEDLVKLRAAATAIDAKDIKKAVKILQKLRERHPLNAYVLHELALAYRVGGQPERAVEVLQPHEEHLIVPMAAALGSALDEAGQGDAAIKTLEQAIERHPDSGLLRSELGTVLFSAKRYDEALDQYEVGIAAEPSWPSNYLHATKLYSESNKRGMALIYGEMFRALEPVSSRSIDLGPVMVDAMRASVELTKKDGDKMEGSVTLAPTPTITAVAPAQDGKPAGLMGMELVNAFEISFGPFLLVAVGKGLSLETLYEARIAFLEMWWKPGGVNKHYDVPLFDWLKRMRDAGHLEAWTYLLYGPAFEDEFEKWNRSNLAQAAALAIWLRENPLFPEAE